MKLCEKFASFLEEIDLKSFENSNDCIYFLDSDFFVRGYNSAYYNFAMANGATDFNKSLGIGSNLLNSLPKALKSYFLNAFAIAKENQTIFSHDFECSSIDTYRLYHQTAYPLPNNKGFVITNHCFINNHREDKAVALSEQHVDSNNLIIQCCGCQKLKNQKYLRWDWVPSMLSNDKANVSHSICHNYKSHLYPTETKAKTKTISKTS